MSRLNDLLRRLENSDPALAKDLRREVDALSGRRAFGLNFERHVPEAVELPGRPVRRGDKVRILPPRGSKAGGDARLWRVLAIAKETAGARTASLQLLGDVDETAEVLLDDLVVVAEFRDPIYPGLVSTGKVERGGDKPYHAVINAENYHALQTLLFTHRAKVDAIYIDPPYNTGAKDWKYNNDYVEGEDLYRHSKWLAFMERRLKLAKELLNPQDSVLIVTIDEKERNRLGLLLEQVFAGVPTQMITTVINPKGASLGRDFARVDEQIFVLYFGTAGVQAEVRDMLDENKNESADTSVKWSSLIRGGAQGIRTDSPGAYYPVFVNPARNVIHSFGASLPWDAHQKDIAAPPETVAVWPPRHPSGVEGRWGIGPDKAAELYSLGALRLGKVDVVRGKFPMSYLSSGIMTRVASGEILTEGRRADGTLVVRYADNTKVTQPKTVWKMQGHNAGEYGSKLVSTLLPGRKFPFPKALYAVEDALGFFVRNKPDATVVDFFAGSGTTAHAVMRLNRQDGGQRRSISVTNNEVSAEEQKRLRAEGFRPGDSEWDRWGICDYITKPRVAAAITGRMPNGDPIKGDYKFTDEFPMADGFEENVEFFTLTYEAPLRVSSNREFSKIAPLLWLRAGSEGRRIDEVSSGWDVADTYGVLADLNHSEAFVEAVVAKERLNIAFIVTDEDRLFEAIARELPGHVEPVRLYEAYLHNFEIETGRSAL
ncbi:site-specific DNA-methyltransferase [Rhodococcus erythropolis]|uniref:site-specific DNA-methyltransferase n=1 Tax=Rhodococcus erythropolis TaxID=1833 RepID=UPI001BA45A2C|nr:DNA methyltransferase [Rhodococcus erythropolis]MBS2993422.1 site-specific DNA-methyltransferase [Rhodococcus erythropolis]